MPVDDDLIVSGLGFDRLVHRKLVHKYALDEAFVTGWECREDRVLVAAVLPRAHSLYCEFPAEDRLPDIALITEICRQACFVVAHTKFDVSVTDNRFQFLLQEMETRLVDVENLPPERPVELVAECTIEETRRRGSTLSALVWKFRVTDRDATVHVADVRMRMVWIDRADWRRMRISMRRGRGLPDRTPPQRLEPATVTAAEVGRRNQDNVVLQWVERDADGCRAGVHADLRHPVLFDHPIDHIFAMVQLEVCRQLAFVADTHEHGQDPAELELSRIHAHFESVAEFDLPLVVTHEPVAPELAPAEGWGHGLTFRQGERLVSRFEATTRQRRKYHKVPAFG